MICCHGNIFHVWFLKRFFFCSKHRLPGSSYKWFMIGELGFISERQTSRFHRKINLGTFQEGQPLQDVRTTFLQQLLLNIQRRSIYSLNCSAYCSDALDLYTNLFCFPPLSSINFLSTLISFSFTPLFSYLPLFSVILSSLHVFLCPLSSLSLSCSLVQ